MRRPGWMLLALAPVMVTSLVAQPRRWEDHNWRVDEKETIRKTFDLSSGSADKRLLVDNISGAIHVTGYGGSQVQVAVEKHIYAYSNEALQEAKRDVKLDMSQQGNFARLYVDGPFRNSNGTNYRGDQYYGYRVIFDYEIQVPYDTELMLKTINDGDILVKKTTADYEISGLNGGIEMDEVSGSGKVHTLNGKLKVTYTKNPAKPTQFHTLNGSIDIYFQPALNADLSFQRLNGAIYSDFEVMSRPSTVSGDLSGGKFIYRGDKSLGGRTGSGGPELSFHTLNGVIRLHSKTF
jgi:hypothetical protein